jgi:hypothetical protein
MEESPTPNPSDGSASASTSLTARLTNIFVAPGEVFDAIKTGSSAAENWIVPLSLTIIVGIVHALVVFSQPSVVQNMRNAQEQALQQQVARSQVTQKAADQARAMQEKIFNPALLKVLGILGTLILNPMLLFLLATIFWLLGRFVFKGDFSYMQAVEATALSGLINGLGAIVTMLLVIITGTIAVNPGPILLVLGHFDPNNNFHKLLAALNFFNLWYVAVLAVGLARLSGTSFVKAAAWFYGLWYGLWAVLALGLPALLKAVLPKH